METHPNPPSDPEPRATPPETDSDGIDALWQAYGATAAQVRTLTRRYWVVVIAMFLSGVGLGVAIAHAVGL